MAEGINSSFTNEPVSNVIDGNVVMEQIRQERSQYPSGFGRIENRQTGEVAEANGGGVVENNKPSREDIKFQNLEKIKGLVQQQADYIRENDLGFTKPKYNHKRYMAMDDDMVGEEINRQQTHLDELIENNEYVPNDQDLAEAEVEMEDEDAEYEEFASRFPSLREGEKFPSPEDLDKMTDSEFTRWFGAEDY